MDEFDVVVIGGGSGGAAVAGRLSEDPSIRVCLLEAGGRNDDMMVRTPGLMPFIGARSNYRYETVPQPGLNGRRGFQPRGRGLGGSSAINAMLYLRGNPWDYDNWRDLGCEGWGWEDVLPVFKRTEDNARGANKWHGGDGPLSVVDQLYPNAGSLAFIESAARLQIARNPDFNGHAQEGVGLFQVTQKDGERWSSARAYLDPARKRRNLDVRTGALATNVVITDGRAVGVAYRSRRGGQSVRAGQVVLAGGAFNTPQLLMLSGIGPGAHLQEQGVGVKVARQAVGSDLQDHVDYVASFATDGGPFVGNSLRATASMARAVVQHRLRRTGPMTTPWAEAGGFHRIDRDAPAPDIQWHFLPAVLEDHGRKRTQGQGYSCHVCVLRPESRGTVRLDSKDAAAAPVIDPRFLSDDRDMATLRAGVRLTHRILQTPPLADFGGRDRHLVDLWDDRALDDLIRSRADTVYHPVGTARMGSDEAAVCDPKLRVRGVDALWVADASVMPRLVSGNTNAPTIMIGERCADFIRDGRRG